MFRGARFCGGNRAPFPLTTRFYMDLTIRQLQRLLHKSRKNPNTLVGEGVPEISAITNHLLGMRLVDVGAVLKGHFWASQYGRRVPAGTRPNYAFFDPHHAIDRLCRKYGPDATIYDVLDQEEEERQKNKPQQPTNSSTISVSVGAGAGADAGTGTKTEPSPSAQTGQNAQQADSQEELSRAEQAAQEWRNAEQAREAAEERRRKNEEENKRHIAEETAKTVEALAMAKRNKKAACRHPSGYAKRAAKQALKQARRAAAMVLASAADGPSLQARRSIASSQGRLRTVAPALRTQMAELINKLVGSTGNTGGNVGPIPRYDSRRLVKRLLVKKPLPNALKEDVISGRPVTLFLPDVSPSCAVQAQAACDIANAAGYAGVSGSDVLVLPHSNGCVQEHDDAYVPWFNGKPVNAHGTALKQLFRDITEGRSSYRLRVVIAVGDHDAVEMYESLAALKSVTRLIWLHNSGSRYGGTRRTAHKSGAAGKPEWSPDALKKLSLIYGCTDQRQMIKGLSLALQ